MPIACLDLAGIHYPGNGQHLIFRIRKRCIHIIYQLTGACKICYIAWHVQGVLYPVFLAKASTDAPNDRLLPKRWRLFLTEIHHKIKNFI